MYQWAWLLINLFETYFNLHTSLSESLSAYFIFFAPGKWFAQPKGTCFNWELLSLSTGNNKIQFPFFFFKSERVWGRVGGCRQSLKQAPHWEQWAWCGTRTHELWDHDLSRSWRFNRLTNWATQIPLGCIIYIVSLVALNAYRLLLKPSFIL